MNLVISIAAAIVHNTFYERKTMITITHESGRNVISLISPTTAEQNAACRVGAILNPHLYQTGEIAIEDEELAEAVAKMIRELTTEILVET